MGVQMKPSLCLLSTVLCLPVNAGPRGLLATSTVAASYGLSSRPDTGSAPPLARPVTTLPWTSFPRA